MVVIDEIDAICGKRENTSRAMESRIVAQLLHSLDRELSLFVRADRSHKFKFQNWHHPVVM